MAWLSDKMTAEGSMGGHLAAEVASSFEVVRDVAPVRQQVLQNLRRAIFEGRFRPGDRLVERELCDLTGVSRTSVREALRQLESEGVVVNLPNRGPAVRTLTAAEARDLYQVRALLEGLAGRLFAERANAEQIDQLRRALAEFEATVVGARDGGMAVRGADRPFYEVMLRGCGNQTAHSVLRSLHDRILLLRATTLSQPGRAADTVAELHRIFEAIERRDPEAAWKACVDHVERAADVAVRALGTDQDTNAREG